MQLPWLTMAVVPRVSVERAEAPQRHLATAAGVVLAGILTVSAECAVAQTRSLEDLEAIIATQQKQIEQQQQQIEEQHKALDTIRSDVAAVRKQQQEAPAASTATASADKREVSNGQSRIKLEVSGQVNRMVNVANDGDSTKAYFVDNQNSTSRFRFVGTAQIAPDLTVGSKIEIGVRPNSSNIVSQDKQDAGDSFDQRIVEAMVDSAKWGRFTLGKGSTSADNAHEVDLSGTDVATYASISDIAGGLQFRDDARHLTGITIAEGFTDYDGNRRDRLRYDTPKFGGFTFTGSTISDQRWDTAMFWGGQNETWKAGGAVSFQEPNLVNVNYRYGGSFSIFHQPTGLSFTTSVGSDKRNNKSPYNLFFKAGLQQQYFDFGSTSFSVDYTYSGDVIVVEPNTRATGHSVGIYAVQNVADYGIDLYGGFRWFTLDPDSATLELKDISILTMGTRFKF